MNDSIAANENVNTGSVYNHISSYICRDNAVAELAIAVNALRNEIKELMTRKLVEAESVPEDIASSTVNEYIKKKYKLGRPPMESEIRDAISKTKDMQQAADYLGISIYTLKRYCIYFSEASGGPPLWQPRRGIKAIKPIRLTEEQSIKDSIEVKPPSSISPFGTGSFFNL